MLVFKGRQEFLFVLCVRSIACSYRRSECKYIVQQRIYLHYDRRSENEGINVRVVLLSAQSGFFPQAENRQRGEEEFGHSATVPVKATAITRQYRYMHLT